MDAIDILVLMKNRQPPEPVSLSAIPLLMAQAIAEVAVKLTVTELDKLVSVGAALYAHEQDACFSSVAADLLAKQLNEES
ncbi:MULTISPECIES: hypothetical protein [Aquitalea]|uniref:Uncharacterized protein n=1 Tax=Aquitalea magnusonii TaxID=332411 RepID=A0A318J6A7_9NEIS|nr:MULTISPECIES: hypothetical protein [Aquitalea]PXX44384.1 hypothetical protein DFR38_11366 [Aquitalea magnusonii]